MEGTPACVLCGTSSPGRRVAPVETRTQVKFLQQIQTFAGSSSFSFLGLSVTPLCEECVCDMTLATENGEEVTQEELRVWRLQMELLRSLRQLCQRVDKYLEGMRRLEENVRRAEKQDWTNENAVQLRGAVIEVVQKLTSTRESLGNRARLPEQTKVENEDDEEDPPLNFKDPPLDDEDLPHVLDSPPGLEDDPLRCEDMDYFITPPPPPQNPLEDNSAEIIGPIPGDSSMLNQSCPETGAGEKMEMEFYSDENDEDDPDYIKSEQESSSESLDTAAQSDPEWEVEEETREVKKKLAAVIKSKKSPPQRRRQPPQPPPHSSHAVLTPDNSIILPKDEFVPDMEELSKLTTPKERRAAYDEQQEKWKAQELPCPVCQTLVERRSLSSHLTSIHELNVVEPRKLELPNRKKSGVYITCEYCDREIHAQNKGQHLRIWHNMKIIKPKPKNPQEPCTVCGKLLSLRTHKRHMLDVHGMTVNQRRETPYWKCDLCRLRMKKSQLVAHLEGHVGAEYVIRCPNTESCSYACTTQFKFRRHLETSQNCPKLAQINMEVWKKDQITCPECSTVCTNLFSLRSHLLRFHENADKPFACPFQGCELRFTLRQSVVLHLAHHDIPRESKTQLCVQCKEEKPLEKMADHLKEKHGADEVIKCTHCPFLFGSREHLVDHLFEHRFTKLYCDICGPEEAGNFNRHGNLAAHYFMEHKIGRKWTCDQCPNVYFKEDSLKTHMNTTHNKKPEQKLPPSQVRKNWQCEDCGHVLKTETGLRSHKIREHGAEPFGCKFCTEKFTNHSAVLNHEKHVHKGVKKQEDFPCTEPGCGAVFKVKSTLKYHLKEVHLGEKGDHVCEECGKAYRMPGDLKNHREVVHLGIRKYKCDECGEAFASTEVLKNHRRIHSGERPFACDLCGQRFRQRVVLYRHLKGHQKKGEQFKPNGPMKQIRKRVERAGNEPSASTSTSNYNNDLYKETWNFLSQ